jgi:hypothetical protein
MLDGNVTDVNFSQLLNKDSEIFLTPSGIVILSSKEALNAPTPMLSTLLGMIIDLILVPPKVSSPIICRLFGNVTFVSFLQSPNDLYMIVTPSGITTDTKLVLQNVLPIYSIPLGISIDVMGHKEKTPPSRRFRLVDNFTDVKLVQPENAAEPSSVKLFGKLIDFNSLQPPNALPPIHFNPLGNCTDSSFVQPSKAYIPISSKLLPSVK